MYFFKNANGAWVVGSTPYSVKTPGGGLAPDFNSGAVGSYTKATITCTDGNATFKDQLITSIKKNAAGATYADFAEFYAAVESFFFRVGATGLVPNTDMPGYYIRIGPRTGYVYAFDRQLTATGFAGTEGVDWENIGGFGNA